MERFVLFLHVLGAVAMGFYLLAPLIVAQFGRLEGEAKSGALSVMRSLNAYAQYGLVLELITGIYLFLQDDYSVLWLVLTIVLFVLIGAFGGMMAGPLRRALDGIRERRDIAAELRKLRVFGSLVCASFVGILFVMMFHRLLA
ncbi:hypothetical protein QWJ34_03670 [Saccharibacillus sp. CPCC 101409]|uniref:hypothetical protein n=1 Tax=Saccharibacillus sp. CPCC 101409 TaxID=3058041 RepID=UPI002671010F|nr:hypothetical protein [Saccharibacillus sp. CPCC 101409]MDO3408857.1 hypothetical protein [Saccharibacillus sp. CPCC 101409]